MSIPRTSVVFTLLVCLCGSIFLAAPATAQPFEDLLTIRPGGSSGLEFGTAGLSPLPADFFGPGSDPFEGQVALHGQDLIDPSSADGTILIALPNPPIWPHDPIGTILSDEVVVVDMLLRSVLPLYITYFSGTGNSESWYLEMTLSAVPAPVGSLTSNKTHVNGGTYNSILTVQPNFKFIRWPDGMELDYDTGLAGDNSLALDVFNCPWVHEPDPMQGFAARSAGIFVSCVLEDIPGNPSTQCPIPTLASEPSGALVLELIPADLLPEPDPFCSIPGSEPDGTHIVFGPSDNPPIPAGFFGPGSDPFDGGVPLIGAPLGPTMWGDFEDADTLIRRSADPFDRCDLASPDLEYVDIEILALNLYSIDPIVITYDGGLSPELWELRMVSSPRNDLPDGQFCFLTATKTHENGGTYQLDMLFFPMYIFTRLSDGVELILDTGMNKGVPLDFTAMDVDWTHSVRPDLNILAPSYGQFVPCIEEVVPGDPGSQDLRLSQAVEITGAGRLTWRPTLIDLSAVETPERHELSLLVWPNPFNPVTTLSFVLKNSGPVSLQIFDLQGRHIRTLMQGIQSAGRHEMVWQAEDENGKTVASGVYLSVLRTEEGETTTKLAVIK